jgi:hypothetical protein
MTTPAARVSVDLPFSPRRKMADGKSVTKLTKTNSTKNNHQKIQQHQAFPCPLISRAWKL